MLTVACSRCARSHEVPEERAGQTFRCVNQNCRGVITVPSATQEPLRTYGFTCPSCSTVHQAQASRVGQTIRCRCGQKLWVPTDPTKKAKAPPVKYDRLVHSVTALFYLGTLSGIVITLIGVVLFGKDGVNGVLVAVSGVVLVLSSCVSLALIGLVVNVAYDIRAIRESLESKIG